VNNSQRRPRESGDPYTAASHFGTVANEFCINEYLWLWVPAFAGTTHNIGAFADSNFKQLQPHLRTLAARCAQVVHVDVPRKTEGAGNAGCPPHPQPRVQNKKSTRAWSPQIQPGSPGIPCAMVLTVSFVLSPATNSFLSPSSADSRFVQARSGRRASADLTSATDARTTRLRRPRQHLSSACR